MNYDDMDREQLLNVAHAYDAMLRAAGVNLDGLADASVRDVCAALRCGSRVAMIGVWDSGTGTESVRLLRLFVPRDQRPPSAPLPLS